MVGCPTESCHTSKSTKLPKEGSQKALEELDVESGRIEMIHLPRGLHPEFITAGLEMDKKIRALGPSPFQS